MEADDDVQNSLGSGWGSPATAPNTGDGWGATDFQDNRPTPKMWGANPSLASADADVSDDEMEGEVSEAMFTETPDASRYFASQLSPEQYQQQTREYTKSAVNALLQSPEYQRKYTTCRMCWSVWFEGMSRPDCPECGGFPMSRPCPVCLGKCGRMWTREVDLSHEHNSAHWDGSCGLPEDEQAGFLTLALRDDSLDTAEGVMEELEQLSTS